MDELLYGGAAGGGKTEWLLAEVLRPVLQYGVDGLLLRRTYPQLTQPGGIVERLLERIPEEVGTYNKTDHRWRFTNGAILQLGYLQRDGHVRRYVGGEYGIIGWDQLEQFTEWQYRRLFHPLRLPADHEALEAGYRPRMLATANPGGIGHTWVKGRFIDPAPPGEPFRPAPTTDEPEPGIRLFVQALPTDNPHLGADYWSRLLSLPAEEQRALLEGDWDALAGQRFSTFRRHTHVIAPEEYPVQAGGGWTRALGVDYGMDAPFCALWGVRGPDGLVVVYRELYRAELTPQEQAELILASEAPGERREPRVVPCYIDPTTWKRQPRGAGQPTRDDGGPPPGSIAWDYEQAGVVPLLRANNDRLRGAALVADKLRTRRDGDPRLLVHATCTNLIRTLPALPRDPKRPEDVDTKAEDHAYDALRYLLAGLDGLPPQQEQVSPAEAAEAARRAGESGTGTAELRRQGF